MGLGYGKETTEAAEYEQGAAAVLRELARRPFFEVSAAWGFLETTTE